MVPIQIQTVDVSSKSDPAIVQYAFSPDIGGATVSLEAIVKGKRVHVFADRDLTQRGAGSQSQSDGDCHSPD